MPMYEYSCRKCEYQFEMLVKGDEKVECPKCNSTKLEKLLSLPGAPRVRGSASLPMSCPTDLPPCGPGCCRL
jgi:putative FmdB family regulatory protein